MAWKGWEDYRPKEAVAPASRAGKFNARPSWVLADLRIVPAQKLTIPQGAVRFDSSREAERFVSLVLEQRAGGISGLTVQRAFELHVTTPTGVKVRVGSYVSDFTYVRDGRGVVEDAKGVRTAVYKLKKRHVEAEYGIQVVEV